MSKTKFDILREILMENNGVMEIFSLCREAYKRNPNIQFAGWTAEIDFRAKKTKELKLVYRDNYVFVALPGYESREGKVIEEDIEPPDFEETSSRVRVLPVHHEDYLPKSCPEYIPQDKELEIIHAHFEAGMNLLLRGPKGEGKTLSFAYYAYKNQIPIIQFDCSEQTKRQDLIGRFLLIGNEVVYQLGVLPTAIEVANQYGKAILVLEEINSLTSHAQKIMNQILDWRRHVYIPEIAKTYRLKEEAKLLIGATMNPYGYGGVYELNEDLRSRFSELYIDYPEKGKENEIVSKLTDLDEDIRNLIIRLAADTRHLYRSGEITYALSTRDIITFANLYKTYVDVFESSEEALRYALLTTVLNRYDDTQERETISKRIYSVFGVHIS